MNEQQIVYMMKDLGYEYDKKSFQFEKKLKSDSFHIVRMDWVLFNLKHYQDKQMRLHLKKLDLNK